MGRAEQQSISFPNGHGGRRVGAGRPKGTRTSKRMPHVARPAVSRHRPHHITTRVTRGTWNLRSQRCFRPIRVALERAQKRGALRVIHFSVQHNHLHIIVEANNRRAMSDGLRTLLSRVARELNIVMSAAGARFEDRYHEHVLKTPTETRNAIYYVLGNRASHLARWGRTSNRDAADEFSSLVHAVVVAPTSWLLRDGWTRAGPPS